ncbi:MAG TPA: preprotein translocase subunit SecE [Tepidisphaeraceae bacterium]|nr:preprotein translocase subunit SecE [Tepidisphaeraceae bacterium]
MAQVTKQEDADQASSDDQDTTVTHVGDGPEGVAGPSAKDLEPRPQRSGGGGGAGPTRSAVGDAGFFKIYKKGQGYWTRMGTALAAGLIIALTSWFFYQQLPPWLTPLFTPENATTAQSIAARTTARNVTMAICAAMLIGFSLLAWRLMNKPSNADFLIATDGEMKKVNWTSRRELIGSTKVVIFFMFLIAFILFGIDIIFGYFFHLINVLDTGPFGS